MGELGSRLSPFCRRASTARAIARFFLVGVSMAER